MARKGPADLGWQGMAWSRARLIVGALLWLGLAAPAVAAELSVTITYLGREEEPKVPLSLVEPILTDEGLRCSHIGFTQRHPGLRRGHRVLGLLTHGQGFVALRFEGFQLHPSQWLAR